MTTPFDADPDAAVGSLPFRIRERDVVLIEQERYEFSRRLPNGNLEFRNLQTEMPYVEKPCALLKLYSERRLKFVGNTVMQPVEIARVALNLDTLREKEIRDRDRWLAYINRYHAAPVKKTAQGLRPLIKEVAETIGDNKPPSWQSLVRMLRNFDNANGDPRSLIPLNRYKGGPHLARLSDEQNAIIESAINSVYLTRQGFMKRSVVDRVINLIASENAQRGSSVAHIPIPHRSTIYRRIKCEDDYVATVAREGKAAADAKYKPAFAGPPAKRIGEVYEIDHHTFDIDLIDMATGFLLGRPWLTLVIDRYSRAVVGFYISFMAPSWFSIAMALHHAIAPKPALGASDNQSFCEWTAFGKPEHVVIDNGPDFVSIHFDEACRSLGIDITRAARWNPEYKGKIERWFRTMTQRYAHALPNSTKSNPKQRGTNRGKIRRAMSIEDFQTGFIEWVLFDYSRSSHRGIGKSTPESKWREGAKKHPPLIPRSMDDLNKFLMYVDRRKLRRDGLQLNNILYNSQDVARIRAEFGKNVSVQVRYDRNNLNEVHITHPRTDEIITVPSVNPEYTDGLSLDMHRAIWARAAAEVNEQVNQIDLAQYRDKVIQETQRALRDRKMTIRRKAQLLLKQSANGFMPGRALYDATKSRMDIFDQMYKETNMLEVEVAEIGFGIAPRSSDNSAAFPSARLVTARPVKQPKADRKMPTRRGRSSIAEKLSTPPGDQPATSIPPSSTDHLKFIANLTEGVTGIPMAKLNFPTATKKSDEA